MSRRSEQLIRVLRAYQVDFAKNSPFYRFYLDRRSGVFDVSRFIADPWEGNKLKGYQILNQGYSEEDVEFSWLRDLQALGGSNARKYAQRQILEFVTKYRQTRPFWKDEKVWNCPAVAERIANWILSFSFYASGASDKFQKEVLSSINEQFSHLMKCIKAEFDPFLRLIALKGIILVMCSMKVLQKNKIQKYLGEIVKIIDGQIIEGYIQELSPIDNFHIFRNLLEIRFAVKSREIEVPQRLNQALSKLAANLRVLRLGDGELSRHSGKELGIELEAPSSRMVDTALSVVDIRDHVSNIAFERVASKQAVILINNKIFHTKSGFNPREEPGINLFDFEASFGANRILLHGDISVECQGFRIKLGDDAQVFARRDMSPEAILFEGETHFFNSFFKFAMKRELAASLNQPTVFGKETLFISTPQSEFFIRFVFVPEAKLSCLNEKTVLVSLPKNEFILNFSSQSKFNLVTQSALYPTVELRATSDPYKEFECRWALEEK